MLYHSTGDGRSAIVSHSHVVGAGWRGLWDNFAMEKVIEPVLPRRSAETVLEAHRKVTLAAALFALYITLDWLTYVFPARFGVTPFNPEAAVAMAMLMFCGLRTAPLVSPALPAGLDELLGA